MPTLSPRLAVISVLAAGLTVLGSAYDAQARQAPTCHGKHATIVGTPGGTFTGTDGRDVIVTNGASGRTKGGSDLICVTGSTGAHIDAGAGKDVVDARDLAVSESTEVLVVLGKGSDTYDGSPGRDVVTTGAAHHRHDTARDHVVTGQGSDEVMTGSIGQKNDDRVDAGADDDRVYVFGMPAGARVSGGRGLNFLQPYAAKPRGHLLVDPSTGHMFLGGREVLRMPGFNSFRFAFPPSKGLELRHGSAGLIQLSNLLGSKDVTYRVDLHQRHGGSLIADPNVHLLGRAVAGYFGGTLEMTGQARHRTTVDLDGWVSEDGHRVLRLQDYTWLRWRNGHRGVRTTILGTKFIDDLKINGSYSQLLMRGGPGGDRLIGGGGPDVIDGGRSGDVIYGLGGDDVLDGGPGQDLVVGGHGTDRCEQPARRCELPLT